MKGIQELPDGKVKFDADEFSKHVAKNVFRLPVVLWVGVMSLGALLWGIQIFNLYFIAGGLIGLVLMYFYWKR